jgi:tRNA(Ile)-lysidine synthase
LKLKSEEKPPKIFPNDPNKVYLNEAKIKYPLVLRHWEKGDYFRPFGMAGKKKKLSDFFTDIKLNRFEKGKVWILESDHKICWIVGFRTDERFKIEADSDSCLAIEFILKNTSQ